MIKRPRYIVKEEIAEYLATQGLKIEKFDLWYGTSFSVCGIKTDKVMPEKTRLVVLSLLYGSHFSYDMSANMFFCDMHWKPCSHCTPNLIQETYEMIEESVELLNKYSNDDHFSYNLRMSLNQWLSIYKMGL